MNSFNKNVIIIATIILVILLIILAVSLSKSLFNESFPPIISDCPDYWEAISTTDNKNKCINHSGVNISSITDPKCTTTTQEYDKTLDSDTCEKYKWATDCRINWDGITNNSLDLCN